MPVMGVRASRKMHKHYQRLQMQELRGYIWNGILKTNLRASLQPLGSVPGYYPYVHGIVPYYARASPPLA